MDKRNEQIKKLERRKMELDKLLELLYVLVRFRNEGGSFKPFMVKNNYKSVAVYGMGRVGEVVCDYLIQDGIKLAYGIDIGPDYVFYDLPIYSPEDDLPSVDVVIVTVLDENVTDILRNNGKYNYIMLDDYLKELMVYGA